MKQTSSTVLMHIPKNSGLRMKCVLALGFLFLTVFSSIAAFADTPVSDGWGPIPQLSPQTSTRVPRSPANGSLDIGFLAGVTEGSATTYVSRPLPDGKILVGGEFVFINGEERPYFVRLNSDGSIDDTYNPGFSGPNGNVYDITPLTNGQVLIGGFFTSYNGVAISGIARLNDDGSLDMTFNAGGTGVTGGVQTIALQTDGRILISSNFIAYNGTVRFAVARLNADGSLDPSFTSPFPGSRFVEQVTPLPDGKILICGTFFINGRLGIMRLEADGSVDLTFNQGGMGADGGIYAMHVQSDGKILIGGEFDNYNGIYVGHTARLNSNGSLDTTFGGFLPDGTGAEYFDVLPDGKILVAGGFGHSPNHFSLFRLHANGGVDQAFAPTAGDATGYHVIRQADGKIILTGFFNSLNGQARRNIVRLNAEGTIDDTFNSSLTTLGQISAIAQHADGKIVAIGNFRAANGIARTRIARFNIDGTLDNSFQSGEGPFPDPTSSRIFLNTVAVQPDGKIVIGGIFGGYNTSIRRGIVRLNADGSLDESFNAGFEDSVAVGVNHILPLSDGKLMVAGQNVFFDGTQQVLGRLNSNGTSDSTFLNGTGNGSVSRMARQPDGKIIAVGGFTNYAGQSRNRIIRVNPDSSLDTTFDIGSGPNTSISSVALQPDGKILIGGAFTAYNASLRNRVARLNPNGSLDPLFDPGSGANSTVSSLALHDDGRIIIGGSFSSYNGVSANRLARLNTDGTHDYSFVSGFDNDPRNFMRGMLIQPDGKLLVSGTFRTYGGVTRNSLARLLTETESLARTLFDYDGDGRSDISVFRPTDGNWYLQQSRDGFYAVNFGVAADKIVPADYDGDGKTDVAVYRPSTGIWYVVNSSDGTFSYHAFGIEEDLPAPADYDGDGKADIAVFRPSTGTWYRQNSIDGSFTIVQFGTDGDKPTIGDFDGDGKADVAVFRPSNGAWYQLNSSDGSFFGEQFGIATDKITPADYDGDGKTDIAIYRPSEGLWYYKNSATPGTYTPYVFGLAEDIPVPGDYDGDGKSDIAVFRPSNGHWYIANSSNGSFTIFPWGQNGDQPTPSAFGYR